MYYIVQRLEWETENKSDEIWLDFIRARYQDCVEHFIGKKGFRVIRNEGNFIKRKIKEVDNGFLMDCYTSDIMDAYEESRNDWD